MDDLRHIAMSRSEWVKPDVFDKAAAELDITVLLTQSHTKRLVQVALESLLRFYPDIPILAVDNLGRKNEAYMDNSSLYLDWKAITDKNVKVWRRTGINSHGVTMDEAMRHHITTKYVLLLDSDVIIERGGFIELMLAEFAKNDKLFGLGTYMAVSFAGDGCQGPQSDDDILHYAHPSCSIYDRERYFNFRPFTDHGAPCCYTCEDAQTAGYKVRSWPVDLYVSHLAGASWTVPYRTIYSDDHDVKLRPFVTFVIDDPGAVVELQRQTDQDFDIISPYPMRQAANIVLPISSKADRRDVLNDIYPLRYRAIGEYVCRISGNVFPGFVDAVKREAIRTQGANEIIVGGAYCYRRRYWQEYKCLE